MWTGIQTQVDGPRTGAMSMELGQTSSGEWYAVVRIVARGGTIERRTAVAVKQGRISILSLTPQLAIKVEGAVNRSGKLTGTVQYWTTKSTYKAGYALSKTA
jgi:hypothetical protein